MTPIVTVDADSPVPPFEQLRVQLSAQIRSGNIPAGVNMPTVRQLAGDLGLAKNTIVRTYRSLEQEGLVRGDRRRGTVVLRHDVSTEPSRSALIADAARRYLAELTRLGVTTEEAVEAVRTSSALRAVR